ncbi:MAG: P1 family peptidase [Gemmatimonadaceae bacterium]
MRVRALLFIVMMPMSLQAQTPPRAQDLGIVFGGTPGPHNAITDVAGVEVGHTTLISGDGRLTIGKGPVRTGVTVILPRGKTSSDPVFGAWFTLNGNGEMTGTTWLQEGGFIEDPIAITNTHSVGVVRDAILQWKVGRPGLQAFGLPIVAETYDGNLNDITGFHVKPEHVISALGNATGGPIAEGNVGGGTGMRCHQFKGGIGTASRVLSVAEGGYTVGVLVQCNYGLRRHLRVGGVPVGESITDLMPCISIADSTVRPGVRRCGTTTSSLETENEIGSIIVVVATDAPLLPHQLKRIATRVSLAIGRTGGFGGNGSGDIFLAFSTANAGAATSTDVTSVRMIPNNQMNALFEDTVFATEEAIVNAMLAATTMTGADGYTMYGLPSSRLQALFHAARGSPAPMPAAPSNPR